MNDPTLCPRCTDAQMEIGEMLDCTTCLKVKKPWGRSAALETASSYCDSDCPGYAQDPQPTSLWPGESRYDFGYGGAMTQPCTCDEPDSEDWQADLVFSGDGVDVANVRRLGEPRAMPSTKAEVALMVGSEPAAFWGADED